MSNQREVFTVFEDKSTPGLGVGLPAKQEGDAVADNQVPVFPCKDSSGNEAKIPLTADNKVAVSLAATGMLSRISATVTPGALNTDTDVAVITLTATEKYLIKSNRASSLQPCKWTIIHDDNGTPDEIQAGLRSSGDFAFDHDSDNSWEFTAGAIGTQEIKIVGSQLRGPLSDMLASLSIQQLA